MQQNQDNILIGSSTSAAKSGMNENDRQQSAVVSDLVGRQAVSNPKDAMKQIKIVDQNQSAISAAINSVEGKSSVNLLSYNKLIDLAQHAERRFEDLGIPIKYRSGAEFNYHPAGPWANCYTYGQGATRVRIIRKSTGWFIKEIERIKVYPNTNESMDLMLTEEQKNIAVTQFCRSFKTLCKPDVMAIAA